jgi:hypothetical protein
MKPTTFQGTEAFPFTPVVIIGAGRSGTNALRDALTQLPGFATWPCDEINPIWRHGNLDWPNDEIPPERATPAVRQSVRKAFWRIWRQQGCPDFVVEKTCANALRVPFVDVVLPEARYIHIVRNGFDIVASARKRWRGELEVPGLPYYLAKARYAPLSDLPRYAVSALKNRVAIKLGRQEHFDSWGPRFAGIDALSGAPLDEIVARQWAACVSASNSAFADIAPGRVFQVRYEDFTADPQSILTKITRWLETPRNEDTLRAAISSIRTSSVGKGQAAAEALSDTIKSVLERPMRAHGYLDQE